MPIISLIAAMASNRVIGRANDLPWNIPLDMKYFKDKTLDHPVIMGRKTFESMPGGALPKRENIVITRDSRYQAKGATTVGSLEEALGLFQNRNDIPGNEIFVIGGAAIYKLALKRADRIYLTEIDDEFDGDTFFPEFSKQEFVETWREDHLSAKEPLPFSFVLYERKK